MIIVSNAYAYASNPFTSALIRGNEDRRPTGIKPSTGSRKRLR